MTDIQSAYRLVPVHPRQIYVDRMLPFGLRSAPKIFNAMASRLEGVEHSLDDCGVVGPPESDACQWYLKRVCKKLLNLEFVEVSEINMDDETPLSPGHPPAPARLSITDISQWGQSATASWRQ